MVPRPTQIEAIRGIHRRFKGQEPVKHIHPALAPLLDETFGVFLYQEQVLRIANAIAGFDFSEADLLRRAMSHFDPGKRMQELKRKFITQANEQNAIPLDIGERIWEMMAAFAGYGFPKAHAASYAKLAWRSAWCKTHYPAEFMAAVLANWGGYYSQRVYLGEARQMGLTVRPPHINYSTHNFTVKKLNGLEQRALFMGLDQVKELTHQTIQRTIRFAPFDSVEDFLTRVDPRTQEAANWITFQDRIDSSRGQWENFISKAHFSVKQEAIQPVRASVKRLSLRFQPRRTQIASVYAHLQEEINDINILFL